MRERLGKSGARRAEGRERRERRGAGCSPARTSVLLLPHVSSHTAPQDLSFLHPLDPVVFSPAQQLPLPPTPPLSPSPRLGGQTAVNQRIRQQGYLGVVGRGRCHTVLSHIIRSSPVCVDHSAAVWLCGLEYKALTPALGPSL